MESRPDFIMGHLLLAASQAFAPLHIQDIADARNRLGISKELLPENRAKRLHVGALAATLNGKLQEAAALYESILAHDPLDLLALRCSYDVYLKLGDARNVLGTIARRAPFWSPQIPGYSLLLSMQAFGLHLCGKMDEAEVLAEKALALNGNDRWAFFTLLQVLETRGNPNHGASFALKHRELFDTEGHIQGRLYFHWALYLFGLGRYDHILRMIQIDMIPRSETTSYSPHTLRYVTQLYWRLKFADQDVTSLHSRLYNAWQSTLKNFTEKEWLFLSPLDRIHCHSICSKESNNDQLDLSHFHQIDTFVLEEEYKVKIQPFSFSLPSETQMLTEMTRNICVAFEDYHHQRFDEATQRLLRCRGRFHQLGESNAEHDLFDLLLLDSASRGSDLSLARLLVNERISCKSQSAQEWKMSSRVFGLIGDEASVKDADSMSYVLGLGQQGSTM
uniref:Tetratricopeptide repeat protein 38 n=1 Tax=Albugo laibachii Nc14 TaxID=890382 RepID=F0W2P9_9STRA|nr:DNA polymerase epsilon subunit putative [Albugo laibachii Nc14]|eukprot:CCA15335.1 DNA polymerase epsilon subunit putative [Albugo laibachii Nc14]